MDNYYSIDLPYSTDSQNLMARLAPLPRPVFLDSCQPFCDSGRFDILSAIPAATITLESGQLTCSEPLPGAAEEDLFLAMEYLLEHFCPSGLTENPENLPFTGGLLGYLGYPRLQGRGEHGIDRAGLGIYLWAVVVDHKRRCSSVHFLPGCPQSTRHTALMALQETVNKSIKFNLLDNFSNDMSRSSYEAAFHRIKEYIAAGDCYQVNLTQRVSSRYSGDPLEAYLRLRQQGGKPFSAYLNWGDTALLSLSPERFLQVRGDHVVSQPIKGTRPRGATTAEDQKLREHLLCSEKDRAENLMIVDLLRNDLGMVCEYGSISAQPLFELQSFSNVHHLVSTIHGTLKKDANSLDLLKNCFPGGSVTGAPKLRAMEIIEELESEPRDVYCGTVFYLGFDGQMDSNITIRTLLCEAGDIHCWAGGGIVADSQCDQEYHECFDKISELINILQQ